MIKENKKLKAQGREHFQKMRVAVDKQEEKWMSNLSQMQQQQCMVFMLNYFKLDATLIHCTDNATKMKCTCLPSL